MRQVEYQSGVLYYGLRQLLGARLSSWLGRKRVLYTDYPEGTTVYGGGFSFARRLPTPAVHARCGAERGDLMMRQLLEHRLGRGYFNVLLVTNGGNRCCRLDECYRDAAAVLNRYIARHPHAVVVTVDGSDVNGCHTTFAEQLSRVDLHFVREPVAACPACAAQAEASKPMGKAHLALWEALVRPFRGHPAANPIHALAREPRQ